jgi:hypothetical protein
MGKMPIIWHHRFGIQGLKPVRTAFRSNPACVAQCANTYHFQAYTKRRLAREGARTAELKGLPIGA